MQSHIIDYFRLMRLPVVGSVAITMLFGALSVNVTSLITLLPLFLIGVLSGVYGFVFNDYVDAGLDKSSPELSRRPLVKGTVSKLAAKGIILVCFCTAYVLVFLFFYKPTIVFFSGLLCLIISDVAGAIHNRFGKQLTGSDFLLALSYALILLFGAFIVMQDGTPPLVTWVLCILVFCQLIYDNAILGGIKDADHDAAYHVKNIAVVSGVRVQSNQIMVIPRGFQAFGVSVRFLSILLLFIPLLFQISQYDLWVIILLIVSALLLGLTCVRTVTIRTFNKGRIRRLLLIQEALWYPAMSLLLVPVIGFFPIVALNVLNGGWYVCFSLLLGGKLSEPAFI